MIFFSNFCFSTGLANMWGANLPESNPSASTEFLPAWPRVPGLQEGCSETRGECFGTMLWQKWSRIFLKLTWLSTLPFKGSRIKQEILISLLVYGDCSCFSCSAFKLHPHCCEESMCHAAAVFGNFPADEHLVSKLEFAGMSLPEYR